MPLVKTATEPVSETAGLLTRYKTPLIALGGVGALAAAGGFYQRHKQRKREEQVVKDILSRGGVPKYAEEIDLILGRHLEKDAGFLSPIMAGAKAIGAGVKSAFGGGSNLNFFRKGMNATVKSLNQQGFKGMARGARQFGNTMGDFAKATKSFVRPAATAFGLAN